MELSDLLPLYAAHPQVAALARIVGAASPAVTYAEGLRASAAPLMLAALTLRGGVGRPFLVVLNDDEEAGYFYHDMVQALGTGQVLFSPPPIAVP